MTPNESPASLEQPRPPRRGRVGWLVLLVILAAAAGGAWWFWQTQENQKRQRQARINGLERATTELLESRRWQDAEQPLREIEALAPGDPIVTSGRERIRAGLEEERQQFIGYWTSQAAAELEAGRLTEADTAARNVLERFPNETEAAGLLKRVAAARSSQARQATLATARQFLTQRQWDATIAAARNILATTPDDPDATQLIAEATAARDKHTADHARARTLLEQARARDHGSYDQQALDSLREAAALAPDNPDVAAALAKMSSYTRTLRVPEDFATPAEALAAARDRDRIVLAPNTWKGPLVINAAVDLQGAGSNQCIVECPPTDGCAITIGPDANGAHVSGITFRHDAFHPFGSDRFSAALVRGGTVNFTDCGFNEASGHGLVVIERGQAVANRCRFCTNGWNGAAAFGPGSRLEVRDSQVSDNVGHGIETWDQATATLTNNRCENNCRNGIHTDNGASPVTIQGNQLIANREFGLVLTSAGAGSITGNTARANLLGGIVVRKAAAALPVTGNTATLNQGPGIVLEKDLNPGAYSSNTTSNNATTNLLGDADLAPQDAPAAR